MQDPRVGCVLVGVVSPVGGLVPAQAKPTYADNCVNVCDSHFWGLVLKGCLDMFRYMCLALWFSFCIVDIDPEFTLH